MSIRAFYAWGLEDIDLRSLLIRNEVEEGEEEVEEEVQDEGETLKESQGDVDEQQEEEGKDMKEEKRDASESVQQLTQEVPEDSFKYTSITRCISKMKMMNNMR